VVPSRSISIARSFLFPLNRVISYRGFSSVLVDSLLTFEAPSEDATSGFAERRGQPTQEC
jgi:hypothetical protein